MVQYVWWSYTICFTSDIKEGEYNFIKLKYNHNIITYDIVEFS